MNLRWRTFEKSMRRRVRRRFRPTKVMRLEALLDRLSRLNVLRPWVYRLLFVLIFGTMLGFRKFRIELASVAVMSWVAGSILWRTSQLVIALRYLPGLEIYRYLPLSDEQVFDLRWRSFRKAALWSVADFTFAFGWLALLAGYGVFSSIVLGMVMALGQWLILIALVVVLARLRPRFPFPTVGGVLMMVPFVALLFLPYYAAVAAGRLQDLARLLPGLGWVLYSLGYDPGFGIVGGFVPALAAGLPVFCFQPAFESLRRRFRLPEPVLDGQFSKPAGSPTTASVQEHLELDGISADEAACEAAKLLIRGRGFLAEAANDRRGWIERLLLRWLVPRHRLVLEFFAGGGAEFTRKFRLVAALSTGLGALFWFFPLLLGLSFVAFYLGAYFLASIFGTGVWRGAKTVKMGGSQVSICSFYPITLRELSVVIMKTTLLRMLILPLPAVAAFLICTQRAGLDAAATVAVESKITVLLLAALPLVSVFLVSHGTNDTSKIRMWIIYPPGAILLLGCGVASLFVDGLWWPSGFLAATALTSGGLMWCYEYGYNHNWFDLMHRAQDKSFQLRRSRPRQDA